MRMPEPLFQTKKAPPEPSVATPGCRSLFVLEVATPNPLRLHWSAPAELAFCATMSSVPPAPLVWRQAMMTPPAPSETATGVVWFPAAALKGMPLGLAAKAGELARTAQIKTAARESRCMIHLGVGAEPG